MYSYIVKNRVRTIQGVLKHYGVIIAGLGFGLILMALQVYPAILAAENLHQYFVYVKLGCILWTFYLIYFRKWPPMIIRPATLHYLLYSKYLSKIFVLQYVLRFAQYIIVAFVITLIMNQFIVGPFVYKTTMVIGAYLYFGFLLSWIKYHLISRKEILLTGLLFILVSTLFVYSNSSLSTVMFFLIIMVQIVVQHVFVSTSLKMNWAKYSEDILFIDINNAAISRNDMVKMLQTTKEYQAKRKRSIFLYDFPLTLKNAVVIKTFIEAIRVPKSVWFLFISILVAGILFVKVPFFTKLPFWGEHQVPTLIGTVAIATYFRNISQLFEEQLKSLVEKHKKGLFIPISKIDVIKKVSMVPMLLVIISTIVIGIVLSSRLIGIVFFLAIYTMLFIIKLYSIMFTSRNLDIIFYTLTFAVTYLFFW